MFTLLVSLAVFLQIVIAIGVFYRRKGEQTNLFFMYLSLALAAWALSNYTAISIPQNQNTIYAIRIVIGFAVIQNTLFYFFAKTFPHGSVKKLPKFSKAVALYSLVVVIATQLPIVFVSVAIKNGSANPNVGPGIILFIVHALITIIGGLRRLFRLYKQARASEKQQLLHILTGSVILWLIVPITNFIITLSAKTTLFVRFSPFYTLVFGGFITYAIIKHRLFDIKLVVARSLGYVLSIGFLASLYGLTTYLITNSLDVHSHAVIIRQLLNICLLTFAVLTYSAVQHFFERVTNRIFYRDAYDPQSFLDQLNKILVATVELDILLRQTKVLIENNLKADKCSFTLIKPAERATRLLSTDEKALDPATIAVLDKLIEDLNTKVFVADELEEKYHSLKKILNDKGIAIIVGLFDNSQPGGHSIGYMSLGFKKSGNLYNKQDIKTLEIVANELVVAIQNALRFEEIQEFAATLQDRVNEATHKLQRTNDKLQQMDETKDEFISMASHQLRTPLTSVKGYLSMVLEGDAGKLNDMQRKLLDQAFVSSQRMVYLIADLLNVSRLRTGKFLVEPVEVNLSDIVEGEVSQLFETAKGRGLTLVYKKPDKFPKLMLDETKIRQVVMNFTDNAIYYTPAGGHITIHLVDKKDTVEFTVVDDGIGVPKHEQHHLFTKFYRAPNAKKARPDGTGLGLFMAQKVIIAQGGSIIFHSQEGKGSTFGFSFAKARLRPPEIAPAAETAKALAS